MDYKHLGIALGIGFGSLATFYLIENSRKLKWKKVGEVSELFIHPVKSCRGVEVKKAECTPLGLCSGNLRDRILMIVDAEDPSKFITARDEPKMVLIQAKIDTKNFLTLSFPDRISIVLDLNEVPSKGQVVDGKLWNQSPVQGYDCGTEISTWICECLEKEKGTYKLILKGDDLAPRFLTLDKAWGKLKTVKSEDQAAFGDMSGYHLLSDSSLADLNNHFADEKFTIRNFRPNIVATKCEKPFAEDNWSMIKIGENAVFRKLKYCHRCVLTTVNPTTGEKHPRTEPLRTLRTYRKCDEKDRSMYGYSPLFGVNLTLDAPGSIHVGDPIYAVC